jgi:hypothetical protein
MKATKTIGHTRFGATSIRSIPGHRGEVVPGVIASYAHLNDSHFPECGIRVRMTRSQFSGLGDLPNLMELPEATAFVKYDPRGFGEFSYFAFRDKNTAKVTDSLKGFVRRTVKPVIAPRT